MARLHSMHDELKALRLRDSDLQEASGLVGADEHLEIVNVESSHGVPVGVEHGVVTDPVSSGAPEDHGVHMAKLIDWPRRANAASDRGRS